MTPANAPILEREVTIGAGSRRLSGILGMVPRPRGVVAFAHGSGSGRYSRRNQYVAGVLREAGLATLLLDLLENSEADDRTKVFDIRLLASRLRAASFWLAEDETTAGLPLGYFGASTGAAAALAAAAEEPARVRAVVSRGGRPDLATDVLELVEAPTLLIVGGEDGPVVDWNRAAYRRLRCVKDLVIIPGATHLFPEPGALEEVARLARNWLSRHLASEVEGIVAVEDN